MGEMHILRYQICISNKIPMGEMRILRYQILVVRMKLNYYDGHAGQINFVILNFFTDEIFLALLSMISVYSHSLFLFLSSSSSTFQSSHLSDFRIIRLFFLFLLIHFCEGKRVLLCTMRNSCNREMLRPEQLIRDYDVLYLVSVKIFLLLVNLYDSLSYFSIV